MNTHTRHIHLAIDLCPILCHLSRDCTPLVYPEVVGPDAFLSGWFWVEDKSIYSPSQIHQSAGLESEGLLPTLFKTFFIFTECKSYFTKHLVNK